MVSFGLRGLLKSYGLVCTIFLFFFLQNKWLFMCWSVVLFKEWDHFFLKIQVFWSTDIFSSGGAKVKWLDDVTLYKQPMNKNKNLASRMHLFCYKSSLITYIVARSGKERTLAEYLLIMVGTHLQNILFCISQQQIAKSWIPIIGSFIGVFVLFVYSYNPSNCRQLTVVSFPGRKLYWSFKITTE